MTSFILLEDAAVEHEYIGTVCLSKMPFFSFSFICVPVLKQLSHGEPEAELPKSLENTAEGLHFNSYFAYCHPKVGPIPKAQFSKGQLVSQ